MNKFIMVISAVCLTASTASAANKGPFFWPVVSVTDGDTIRVDPDWLPDGLKLSIRVRGIDTPEKAPRASCAKEASLGQRATDYTTDFINKNRDRIRFDNIDWDKYGGRMLADVYVGGILLSKALIEKGLAREYYGDKKKSWCE